MNKSFKILSVLFIVLLMYSCNDQKPNKSQGNQELSVVADSISVLMNSYHYNPSELTTKEYLKLEKKVKTLANTSKTADEFINNYNDLWQDGPFSHVRLGIMKQPAEAMADYIDSLKVGDQSVSISWEGKTAILTLNTMTGLDTKEKVFEAYKLIAKNPTESLIIDLRNNSGGTFAGVPLVGHLLTEPIDAGIFVSKKWWDNHTKAPSITDIQNLSSWQGWSIKSFWHDVQEAPLTRIMFKPMQPHFKGPVYVLINNKTASAAEMTVDGLAQLDNVTIIGETSEGVMLSQKMYDLPSGLQLSLPIADYYSTRMGRIEGQGVTPDVTIDQSLAMDVAFSLINGKELNQALADAKQKMSVMQEQPLGVKPIYLLGDMNDWGKDFKATPQFEYKGKGIYESIVTLKKGRYEFKIAPLDWAFDYGANPNDENVIIGQVMSLVGLPRSNNLIIDMEEESKLTLSLDVNNIKQTRLLVKK